MGTRSLTIMQDQHGEEVAVLYRQMDGYPSGHGQDLAEFLSAMVGVNGYSSGGKQRQANGIGCLAAQIVAHFKEGVGSFYLEKAGTRDVGEEYMYFVGFAIGEEPNLRLEVPDGTVLFEGKPTDFLSWKEPEED